MADLDHTYESDQLFFIDFIASEQFRVIAEIAQKPIQLPQSFRGAVEPPSKGMAGEGIGFDYLKVKRVVSLLPVPAILHTSHADQEAPVGKGTGRRGIGLVQTFEAAPHAAPAS